MMPDKGEPRELMFRAGETGFVFSTLADIGVPAQLFAFSTISEAADWLFGQYDVAGDDFPELGELKAAEDG